MFNGNIDIHDNTELNDVVRLFYESDPPEIGFGYDKGANAFTVEIGGKAYSLDCNASIYSDIPPAHKMTRLAKIALYDALGAFSGRSMPWGALTGVRPTKLFYENVRLGKSADGAQRCMSDVYRVSPFRADVLRRIFDAQKGKVHFSDEYVNLYVHVPYCTTRCAYCSFVSDLIDKRRAQSEQYVDLLCREISSALELIRRDGRKILSVYIGGGTPTALDDVSFHKLLSAIGDMGCEYTCEAGRPDTVTREKCEIMRDHGVTRVCVNPQTLNDDTLALIGRGHSAKDFFDAYSLVKSYGFDINCDLIAGLSGETIADFVNSFDGIKALLPQNITVHSLSKKNGSAIRYDRGENSDAPIMLDYALRNASPYEPYYLYRQKRQAGNLENVGFSLKGRECVNNITVMEETVGVVACGAGAISKFIRGGNIVRFANMRDTALYISRFDERLKAKIDCYKSVYDR